MLQAVFAGLQSKTNVLIIAVLLFTTSEFCIAQNTQREATLEQNFSNAAQKKDYKSAMEYAILLGDYSVSIKKYDKAITWYSQASNIATQLKTPSSQFEATRGLGIVYLYQKNYSKAAESFEKSIAAAREGKNKLNEATGLFNVAQAEEMAGYYKRTITPLEKALALAVELRNETLQLDCYAKLADNHQRLGNKKESGTYRNLYSQLDSSRRSIELKNQKLSELNKQVMEAEKAKEETESTLHEQEEKLKRTEDSLRQIEAINSERQLQINLLEKDKELSDLKIKKQNTELENDRLWRNSLITGMALALVLITVIILNYNNRMKANKQIHKQNENIKSSITYAKRIQEAMLPSSKTLADYFSDSFVLFNPRDSVSGDFYWFTEIKNTITSNDLAFAAVDCTGHGIPGAFMSMVGMKSLNGIINRGILHSNEILSTLHEEVRSSLRQPETGNNDGMDIALCIYRKDKKIIEFSGAKNPMVYIQNGELFQIKGDIHPIGGSKSKPSITFKKHEISIDKPTMLYLFSDGYRDQFGGKDNSKFMSKKFNQLLLSIHHMPLQAQKELLEKTIIEWRGSHPQTDDILVMGVKLNA